MLMYECIEVSQTMHQKGQARQAQFHGCMGMSMVQCNANKKIIWLHNHLLSKHN